jgi:hypothetical protein
MSVAMPDLPTCTPPMTLHCAPSLSLFGSFAFISIVSLFLYSWDDSSKKKTTTEIALRRGSDRKFLFLSEALLGLTQTTISCAASFQSLGPAAPTELTVTT